MFMFAARERKGERVCCHERERSRFFNRSPLPDTGKNADQRTRAQSANHRFISGVPDAGYGASKYPHMGFSMAKFIEKQDEMRKNRLITQIQGLVFNDQLIQCIRITVCTV
jgi:hypothetical protein